MRVMTLLVGLLVASAPTAGAQADRATGLQGPYLGQKPPGTAPVAFAPGIVSTNATELHGAFSPDGREFFFTRRASANDSTNRLLAMREEKGRCSVGGSCRPDTPQRQPAQDDFVQPPQLTVEVVPLAEPPMPKVDGTRKTSSAPHVGHAT